MLESILVMVGGGLGSLARYWVGTAVVQRFGTVFPAGTLLINVAGSFVLGVLFALGVLSLVGSRTRLLLGAGFCGGFTTFSTFSVESLNLLQKGSVLPAIVYLLGNVLGGLAAAWLGFGLTKALS